MCFGGCGSPHIVTKVGKREVCYSFEHITPLGKPSEGNVLLLGCLERAEAGNPRFGVVDVTMKGISSLLCTTRGRD
jgi:hypothetical protein